MTGLKKAFEVFRENSKTFYFASLLFDKRSREEIAVLYRFLRTVDDFVDKPNQDKENFFKFKRETLLSLKINRQSENSCINDFNSLFRKYSFEIIWVESFFDSMERDFQKRSFNKEELDKYVYGSAEVVGLMVSRILLLPLKSDVFAKKLGRSFQDINFIRDLKEDIKLGRKYFSIQELQNYGVISLEDNELTLSFIKLKIKKWFEFNDEAVLGFKFIPKRPRIAIKTANDLYKYIANKIYQNPETVFKKAIKPNRIIILLIVIKNLLQVGVFNK